MKAQEIADHFDGTVEGDGNLDITSLVDPSAATGANDMAVALEPRFFGALATTKAEAAFVPAQAPDIPISSKTVIHVQAGRKTLPQLSKLFARKTEVTRTVHPTAFVHESAVVGVGSTIGPGTVISRGVTIGQNAKILANVTILDGATIGENALIYPGVVIGGDVVVGNNVILHPNATLGADGFSFLPVDRGNVECALATGKVSEDDTRDSRLLKVQSLGGLIVEDDVEIGASTTVDAGTLVATRIGRGTKVDNLVQVGHNVQIGEDCLICAQVGIAGSSKIGNRVTLGGRSAVSDNLTVGDDVVLGAAAAAGSSVPAKSVYLGIPAVPRERALKDLQNIRRLDRIIKKVLGKQ